MKRYFIEDAKCKIGEGGIACGPVDPMIGATVKFRECKKEHWLTVIEYNGFPNYHLTAEDSLDRLVDLDVEDENEMNFAEKSKIETFNGIALSEEYSDTFDSISEDPENPAIPLIRYLIALVSCGTDEEQGLIEMAKGKYIDEVEVPASEYEEDYLGEMEEDDE